MNSVNLTSSVFRLPATGITHCYWGWGWGYMYRELGYDGAVDSRGRGKMHARVLTEKRWRLYE